MLTFKAKSVTNAEFRDDYFLVKVSINEFELLPSFLIKIFHWISATEHVIRKINTFKVLCSFKYRYLSSKVIISNIYIFKFS
jgi:hypothetical protein